ncbi:RabGAP/TBC [Heliocybe sulcata]|uniref:RabGAP/TBC n=1 Tax=Heliocybe sulcata TaxID=5364 RepID=A0A5C3MX06_9AGAM|nr:RabGAP/TBC [Heliocybe sulcata]
MGVEDLRNVFDRIFNSSLSLAKIKDAVLGGRLLQQPRYSDNEARVCGRSIVWKVFLTPEDPLKPRSDLTLNSFLESWKGYREQYADLLLQHLRAPDGSYEERLVIPGSNISPGRSRINSDLDKNNPLSLDQNVRVSVLVILHASSLPTQNPWKEWFASMELRKTIQQDVERTFPDVEYFRDAEVQYQLTNILFVYSVTHPHVGYRQGMHELLAPLYYALEYDLVEGTQGAMAEVCDRTWLAADAWRLFVSIMDGAGRWYEWRENPTAASTSSMAAHANLNAGRNQPVQPYVTPVVQACHNIQSNLLKSVDPELWNALHSTGIEPTIYGMRMLRLLFTREFTLQDAMILWDGLFAVDPTIDLAQWICVAMLIRIRNQLIPASDNEQLMYLLRYPTLPAQSDTGDSSSRHHTIILIQQALALQMCPTPSTGAAMVQENRNFLHILAEVPERAAPQLRRPVRRGERERSGSDMTDLGADASVRRAGHSRNLSSQQLGLDVLAKGLLDRGEALGINKTSFMNAVTEFKRNLPELASLVRTPPATSASFTDFPMVDERPAEERPPWEPRSRFELEREIAQLRTTQKRLGDSVSWIVDTLLQDEDGTDRDAIQTVKARKREALECLTYVRDTLTTGSTFVDEERLVGEEELKKRKATIDAERAVKEAESAARRMQEPLPAVTISRPSLPTAPISNESRQRPLQTHHSAGSMSSRSPPATRLARSPSPPLRPTSSTSTPTVLTPNANATPMAPWAHTKPKFSEPLSHFATLPRPPPRVSQASPSNFSFPPRPEPPPPMSPTQGERHEVQQDPLGALP